jgi:two-component system, OmpR family, response regulator QseB
MRILLVEDHPALRELVAAHLERRGFAVDTASRADEACAALDATAYDAMVLDLGLPDDDGFSVLTRARLLTKGQLPTLIVTARDAVSDRVRGLDAGADDYIVKPFDLVELDARIRAVLRRPGSRPDPMLTCGSLVFDPSRRAATIAGTPIDLTRREADLLDALLKAPGKLVIRDVLEERLYSFNEPVTPNALEATVSRLRRRLSGAGLRIETRRGIGYRLVAEMDDPA